MSSNKIIAVDFDGTLVTNKYPDIGEPIAKNITKLKKEMENNAKVILWTNRCGKYLEEAIAFCDLYEIKLAAVNENLPEVIEEWATDCRKVFAHEYWDDKGVYTSEKDIGDFSDGYHTFNELYHHRAVLFSVICNLYPRMAWKSVKHHDGTMYEGMFIVGFDTPSGQATYHYDICPYWDIFKVQEVEKAPTWDGHTPEEALLRISTIEKEISTSVAIEYEPSPNLSPREIYLKRRKIL